MSAEYFTLDSNILVYQHDASAGARQQLAQQILDAAIHLDCILPLQAVTEFYSAATRKRIAPASEAAASAEEFLAVFPSVAASAEAVRGALQTALKGKASFWDALLIATAAEAGCTAIITEDGDPGAVLHGVRIVPPFAGDALSPQVKELLGL